MGIRSRASLGLVAILVVMGIAPALASAHVNRTAGPYTFFLLLVEEPTFETDHAGFEFSVRDGDRTVRGVDRTAHATATDGIRRLEMTISPADPRGFYTVDRDLQGRPFDPGKGGDWTLHLSGDVEGLMITVDFPVIFPAYPRTSSQAPAPASQAVDGPIDPWTVIDALLLIGALTWIVLRLRSRPRPRLA